MTYWVTKSIGFIFVFLLLCYNVGVLVDSKILNWTVSVVHGHQQNTIPVGPAAFSKTTLRRSCRALPVSHVSATADRSSCQTKRNTEVKKINNKKSLQVIQNPIVALDPTRIENNVINSIPLQLHRHKLRRWCISTSGVRLVFDTPAKTETNLTENNSAPKCW